MRTCSPLIFDLTNTLQTVLEWLRFLSKIFDQFPQDYHHKHPSIWIHHHHKCLISTEYVSRAFIIFFSNLEYTDNHRPLIGPHTYYRCFPSNERNEICHKSIQAVFFFLLFFRLHTRLAGCMRMTSAHAGFSIYLFIYLFLLMEIPFMHAKLANLQYWCAHNFIFCQIVQEYVSW